MDNTCGFSKILKLIDSLQRNSLCNDSIDNTCSKPFLGNILTSECSNTRPVTFYGRDNNLITVDYTATVGGEELTGTSSTFRVQRVDGCCVVLNILIENPDATATTRPYISINQTITLNLNCVCALKCLNDTFVDL